MKDYTLVISAILWFTATFLLDIFSTSLFLNSPNCIESNRLFAPFSHAPFLLYQLYFLAWFFPVASSIFMYLAVKHFKGPWILGICWYWLPLYFGYLHLYAFYYNMGTLPRCWA